MQQQTPRTDQTTSPVVVRAALRRLATSLGDTCQALDEFLERTDSATDDRSRDGEDPEAA